MIKRSKLNLGDLAGSEKIDKDEEMKSKHLLELRNINLSLTTLGKVIMHLAKKDYIDVKTGYSSISLKKAPTKKNFKVPGSTAGYVPFRESKLTRLLQDSIGGNCMTYLIATISPVDDCAEETLSTMKFADRASLIVQKVSKNEFSAKDDALIHKLQGEINYLKELLQLKKKGKQDEIANQLYSLKQENQRLKSIAMTNQEIENMMKENREMKMQLQKL